MRRGAKGLAVENVSTMLLVVRYISMIVGGERGGQERRKERMRLE